MRFGPETERAFSVDLDESCRIPYGRNATRAFHGFRLRFAYRCQFKGSTTGLTHSPLIRGVRGVKRTYAFPLDKGG